MSLQSISFDVAGNLSFNVQLGDLLSPRSREHTISMISFLLCGLPVIFSREIPFIFQVGPGFTLRHEIDSRENQ